VTAVHAPAVDPRPVDPRPVDPRPVAADTRAGTWAAAREGVRDVAPLLAGYVPFALVIGVTIAAADPVGARWLSTILILGGSAQLLTLELLDGGAALPLVILAGLVTHARLLAYSASLAPAWAVRSRSFRLVAAALLIDPTWALATRHLARGARHHRAYVLGAGLGLAIGWVAVVTVGVVAGTRLVGLVDGVPVIGLVAPLSLSTIVAPQLVDRRVARVAGSAAVVGLLTAGWPAGAGLVVAVAVAVGAGSIGVGPADEEVAP
jgi:predicted branched-subunit amino acid permease